MARSKATKKATRRWKRKVKKAGRKPKINFGIGVPSTALCRLRYHELIPKATFTMTTGSAYDYIFRLNSLYDPNYSGVGHQPLLRDQISALYRYLRVYAVKYSILITTDVTDGGPGIIGTVRPSFQTAVGDFDEERERIYGKKWYCSPYQKGSVSGYISMHKVLGVEKKDYMTDDLYQAAVGGTPSREVYLHIQGQPADAASNAKCNVDVMLTYYTQFELPTVQSSS